MIHHAEFPSSHALEDNSDSCRVALARYGNVPVVARFQVGDLAITRGQSVVVETDRGEELATLLEFVPDHLQQDESPSGSILRTATESDRQTAAEAAVRCEGQFGDWLQRCQDWKLQLELIDIEQTLDGKLILYVLNDRGPETTRLALLAAAGGHGIIHVQPVVADGIDTAASAGGGCGTGGGCGCGHS
jgi:hypothetical protein